jgi:long-chain fatty acid transport protein
MRYRVLTLIGSVFVGLQSAHAGGLTVYGQDGFALGRADAFTATADNAAALYYNPAGITQLARPEARFGSYGVTYQGRYQAPGGGAVDSQQKYAAVPHFYYVQPLPERRLALGLASYSPFGLGMRWPESSGFRSVAMDAKLEYVTLQPTLAWQVLGEPGARAGEGQRLSVAVGPMLNYARTELRQGLTATVGNDYFRFNRQRQLFLLSATTIIPQWA